MTVKHATIVLAQRYVEMSKPGHTEHNLAQAIIANANTLPIDKLSRWLGFVQALCTVKGYTSVTAERDFSRPLFHKAYEEMGIDIPETINV